MMKIIQNENGSYRLENDNVVLANDISNNRVANFTKSYYQNKLAGIGKIELNKTITDTHIEITSDSTRYIKLFKEDVLNISTMVDDLKQLNKELKSKGVKTKGYNKLRKFIIENFSEYLESVSIYNELFDNLCKDWKEYDLYNGMSCDEFYNKTLQKNYHKAEKILNSSWIVKYNKINDKIESLFNQDSLIEVTY